MTTSTEKFTRGERHGHMDMRPVNTAWVHARARVVATVRDGWTLLVIAALGGASLLAWGVPGAGRWPLSVPPAPDAGAFERGMLIALPILITVGLGMMLGGLAPGRTPTPPAGSGFKRRPMPALPLGRTAIVLAEASAILALFLAARVAIALVLFALLAASGRSPFTGPALAEFARATSLGVGLTVPTLLIGVAPDGVLFDRLGVLLGAMAAAAAVGLLRTPGLAGVTCALLAVLSMRLRPAVPSVSAPERAAAASRSARASTGWPAREPRPPLRQLVADFALPALTRIALLVVAELIVIGISFTMGRDARIAGLPPVLFGSLVVACLYGVLVLFRPAGRSQPVVRGRHSGLALEVWSTLPVRPEWVLRGFYLHALLTGAIGFGLTVAFEQLWRSWSAGGWSASMLADSYALSGYTLTLTAVIPCLAGQQTASAAGRPGLVALSSIAWFAIAFVHGAAGRLHLPMAAEVGALAVLALLGGGPALLLLRRVTR